MNVAPLWIPTASLSMSAIGIDELDGLFVQYILGLTSASESLLKTALPMNPVEPKTTTWALKLLYLEYISDN